MSDGSFSVAAQFHFDSICQRWIGVQCITLPWLSWPMDEGQYPIIHVCPAEKCPLIIAVWENVSDGSFGVAAQL